MTDFDARTADDLRALGSVKWSRYPAAIGAFVAEMDFGMAPPIAAALHEAVDAGRSGYLPSALSEGLQTATADWAAEHYGWPIAPAQVQPIADVLTGLDLVLRRFSDPGRPVIVPTPAYMPFLTLQQATGREVIEVPSPDVDGRYELDLDGIDRAFQAGADVLVLCNPWNPVGRVLSRDELLAVADVVDRHGGRVFSDEIHAPVTFGGSPHVPYASVSDVAAAHTITATSASKAFNLPGLKCAQLILSNDEDAARYEEVAGFVAHGASTFGVIANIAAYRQGRHWLDELTGHLDGNRRALGALVAEHLPGVGYRMPEGTYIAWLDARGIDLGAKPADAVLARTGVALTDGSACGAAGAGFLRLIFATPRPILIDASERMGAGLTAA